MKRSEVLTLEALFTNGGGGPGIVERAIARVKASAKDPERPWPRAPLPEWGLAEERVAEAIRCEVRRDIDIAFSKLIEEANNG